MRATRCGSITGGWTRVARINMSDPQQTCPYPLTTLTTPLRMCVGEISVGCASVQYPTLGLDFTQVCGQAIGYMYSSPDGLDAIRTSKNIDSLYVDGLSNTYGSPRHHLWTYAAGVSSRCLCQANNRSSPPPSFVGQHYYCDGWSRRYSATWYTQYPSRMVRAIQLATLAATHQTCRGSTGRSAQPPLMTLKCAGAVTK